jgi:hypothetical protein
MTCPDPWHHDPDAPHTTHHDRIGDGELQSYSCLTCGGRTATIETYTPVDKVCTRCGDTFDGMPDIDQDLCARCQVADIAAYFGGLP